MARIRDGFVAVYHPVLDAHAEIPVSALPSHRRRGWTDDRLAEIVKVSQDAGLYDDQLEPLSEPAPAPIDGRPAGENTRPSGGTTTPDEED